MASGAISFELVGIGSELKERLLAVPIYQRSYAWTVEEVTEFWQDLRAAFSEGASEYFLGTIVLTKQGIPPRDTVIDGQQRLATTSILVAAVRDEFAKRSDSLRASIVQRDYLSTSDLQSASEIPRLSLNSDDQYLKVIVLEVPSDTDAFLIFETLNDRGADLTIADLLKNYLFGPAGPKLDAVRDGWMMVLGSLEISSENMLFTTFLRHYWSSRLGAVRERELYKSIKEHVVTTAQVLEFINDLQTAATLYSALLNSDHEFWDPLGAGVKENIETIIRLDLEQNRPLLLAALQHLQPAEIKMLLRAIVAWSVRGIIVGGIGGGTAEKNYCQAAVGIRKGKLKTTRDILSEISAIVPSDEQFKTAFSVAVVPTAALARYYLIALQRQKAGEKEPELVSRSGMVETPRLQAKERFV